MSLDKAIRYGKEHRRVYIKGKAVDVLCRNHNVCSWCRNNRTIQATRAELKAGPITLEKESM